MESIKNENSIDTMLYQFIDKIQMDTGCCINCVTMDKDPRQWRRWPCERKFLRQCFTCRSDKPTCIVNYHNTDVVFCVKCAVKKREEDIQDRLGWLLAYWACGDQKHYEWKIVKGRQFFRDPDYSPQW